MATFLNRPNSKFSTTLAAAVNDTVSTSFSLNALPGRYPCVLLIDPGTSNQEKVQVTGEGTGTVTVVRNYDSAGAHTHSIGASVVDYDSPEYVTKIADVIEANFNADSTPAGNILASTFASAFPNFVSSGLNPSVPPSSLTMTIPLGVVYYSGVKYAVSADGGHTYNVSDDTYVDVNPTTGIFTYVPVSNGAAAPALTANSIRIAKVITNASVITAITQNGSQDSLGNVIYPSAPRMGAETLQNKTITNTRTQKRVYSTTSLATLTPEIANYDIFVLTAQAAALTIANHSTSVMADGEMILIRILDNGTAQTITFGTDYVAYAGVALPTTTTASKRMEMLFEWHANLGKFNLVWVGQGT